MAPMTSFLTLSPLLFTTPTLASYAFYVGKDLTADGSVMLGGTGEEVSSHWLQLFPPTDHPANATITVGVTENAVLPGHLIEIPQVSHTFRYMSMEYSDFEGFPAPLTNGGLNEKGVAVRDGKSSILDLRRRIALLMYRAVSSLGRRQNRAGRYDSQEPNGRQLQRSGPNHPRTCQHSARRRRDHRRPNLKAQLRHIWR